MQTFFKEGRHFILEILHFLNRENFAFFRETDLCEISEIRKKIFAKVFDRWKP